MKLKLKMPIKKIISGGQTGVDRAALDWAIAHKIPHGGSIPKGRRTEDGPLDKKYQLTELSNPHYPERTKKNIQDSDGTLILYENKLSGGTLLTFQICKKLNQACYLVDLAQIELTNIFETWLKENKIEILNIAGPRQGKSNIYQKAFQYLKGIIHK